MLRIWLILQWYFFQQILLRRCKHDCLIVWMIQALHRLHSNLLHHHYALQCLTWMLNLLFFRWWCYLGWILHHHCRRSCFLIHNCLLFRFHRSIILLHHWMWNHYIHRLPYRWRVWDFPGSHLLSSHRIFCIFPVHLWLSFHYQLF